MSKFVKNKEPSNNRHLIEHHVFGLSVTEIGLGSLLHSFKVPFSGKLLALNQGFILSKLQLNKNDTNRWSAHIVSTNSAVLKSLSPSGKKLTPMLAIAMQGLLFNLSTRLLGKNSLGIMVGNILLSTWSFIQPFIIYYLIFGKNLIFMTEYFLKKINKVYPATEQTLTTVLLVVLSVNFIMSIVVSILAIYSKQYSIEEYTDKLSKIKKVKKISKKGTPFKMAIMDMLNPLFLLTWFLTLLFLIFSKSTFSNVVWLGLRPLAVGLIIFYIIRKVPVEKLSKVLGKSNSEMLKTVMAKLEKI